MMVLKGRGVREKTRREGGEGKGGEVCLFLASFARFLSRSSVRFLARLEERSQSESAWVKKMTS